VCGRDSVDIAWGLAVGSASNQSLPVNSTDRTRVLLRLDGATRNDDVSADLASLAVERAVPIRRFFAWPGKRNYEGLWWSSTVRAHVPFESLLEREYLMWTDFEPHVVAIAAQPLALLWPRGTADHKNHVPDFFVRLSNGDGGLVDVRHPHRVDDAAAQFDLTRHVCAEVGWQYAVFTGWIQSLSRMCGGWPGIGRTDAHRPMTRAPRSPVASHTPCRWA
jgi:hypothetical protein